MKVKKTLSLILACLMFSSFAAACNDEVVEYAGTGPGTASTPMVGGGSGYGSGLNTGNGGTSGNGNVNGMETNYTGNTSTGTTPSEGSYNGGLMGSLGNQEGNYTGTNNTSGFFIRPRAF